MIPLRDTIPSSSFPIVTAGLITANVLAFFYELSLGRELEMLRHAIRRRAAAVFRA